MTTTTLSATTLTDDRWGGWRLDPDRLTLARGPQEIDLTACRTPAAVLAHLVEVSHLRWGTDHVVSGLVRALDDVLRVRGHITDGAALHGGSGLTLDPEDVERFTAEFARSTDR